MKEQLSTFHEVKLKALVWEYEEMKFLWIGSQYALIPDLQETGKCRNFKWKMMDAILILSKYYYR